MFDPVLLAIPVLVGLAVAAVLTLALFTPVAVRFYDNSVVITSASPTRRFLYSKMGECRIVLKHIGSKPYRELQAFDHSSRQLFGVVVPATIETVEIEQLLIEKNVALHQYL